MYTPQGDAGGRRSSVGTPRRGETDSVERLACCLAGLVVTSAVAFSFYPVLVAVTQPLRILSSTAIVFVLLFVWFLVWLGTELVWEWRTGRISFPG